MTQTANLSFDVKGECQRWDLLMVSTENWKRQSSGEWRELSFNPFRYVVWTTEISYSLSPRNVHITFYFSIVSIQTSRSPLTIISGSTTLKRAEMIEHLVQATYQKSINEPREVINIFLGRKLGLCWWWIWRFDLSSVWTDILRCDRVNLVIIRFCRTLEYLSPNGEINTRNGQRYVEDKSTTDAKKYHKQTLIGAEGWKI